MLEFLRNVFDPLFSVLGGLLTTFHTDLGAPWWLSIVMLTVIIKTLLLPLTFKQVKNARKMQALKPEIEKIQAKYKNKKDKKDADPQEQQREVMALYQSRGANPLSGCLPALIQLPIFMTLYFTIKEFEHLESFRTGGLFWFTDLTASDPLHILPILYIGTMMAAQEVTLRSTPMQSQQKMIMRFMPPAIGLFLMNFPAGLLVYYVANNTLTFTQNLIAYRLYPAIVHELEEETHKTTTETPKDASGGSTKNQTPKKSSNSQQKRRRKKKKSKSRR